MFVRLAAAELPVPPFVRFVCIVPGCLVFDLLPINIYTEKAERGRQRNRRAETFHGIGVPWVHFSRWRSLPRSRSNGLGHYICKFGGWPDVSTPSWPRHFSSGLRSLGLVFSGSRHRWPINLWSEEKLAKRKAAFDRNKESVNRASVAFNGLIGWLSSADRERDIICFHSIKDSLSSTQIRSISVRVRFSEEDRLIKPDTTEDQRWT